MTDLTPGRHEHRGRHERLLIDDDDRAFLQQMAYDLAAYSRPLDEAVALVRQATLDVMGAPRKLVIPCPSCDEPWDTKHDEVEGCPYVVGEWVGPLPRKPSPVTDGPH